MTQTPNKSEVTDWLLELATDMLPGAQKCGDARAEFPEASPGVAGPPIYPYNVLYSIPGGSIGGPPLGQAQGDARLLYQMDSVGKTRRQAEQAADRMRNWIAGRGPDGRFVVVKGDPDNVHIHDRIVDGTPGAPLQEGQPPNEVFTVSETFGIDVTVR